MPQPSVFRGSGMNMSCMHATSPGLAFHGHSLMSAASPSLLPFGPTPSRDYNVPEADYKWADLPGNNGSRGGYMD